MKIFNLSGKKLEDSIKKLQGLINEINKIKL